MEILNEISKPLTIRREEYIQTLTKATNEAGLPMFLIEYILRDLLAEVSSLVKQEALAEKTSYQKALEQKKENNEELKGGE